MVGDQSVREFQQKRNGIYKPQINIFEIKVVKLALLAYSKQFQMKAIHFQIDNTTPIGVVLVSLLLTLNIFYTLF